MPRPSARCRRSNAIGECSARWVWPTHRWLREEWGYVGAPPPTLERQPRADLQFPSRRHCHRDRSELWRVDEPVRRPKIGFVERVKGFGAELERGFLGETKRPSQREVQTLHARAVHGVAAGVPVGKGRGRGESGGIEPLAGGSPGPGRN